MESCVWLHRSAVRRRKRTVIPVTRLPVFWRHWLHLCFKVVQKSLLEIFFALASKHDLRETLIRTTLYPMNAIQARSASSTISFGDRHRIQPRVYYVEIWMRDSGFPLTAEKSTADESHRLVNDSRDRWNGHRVWVVATTSGPDRNIRHIFPVFVKTVGCFITTVHSLCNQSNSGTERSESLSFKAKFDKIDREQCTRAGFKWINNSEGWNNTFFAAFTDEQIYAKLPMQQLPTAASFRFAHSPFPTNAHRAIRIVCSDITAWRCARTTRGNN